MKNIKQQHVAVALETFLGASTDKVVAKYAMSKSQVYNIVSALKDERQSILRSYYQNGEDIDKASSVYTPPTEDMPLDAVLDRLTRLEQRLDALFELAASPATAPAPRAQEGLPALKLGDAPRVEFSNPSPAAEGELDTADEPDEPQVSDKRGHRFATDDIRSNSYRIHVCKQAVAQWRQLFPDSINLTVSDRDIIRRVIGIYYAGTVEGKGMVWTVKGVNRYSFDGVVLKCTQQGEAVYISSVEKRSIDEL
jgi:hypothetical protein